MATNPGYEYAGALKAYEEAQTDEEKLKALKVVYQAAPKHKSAEKLLADIKIRISKLKSKIEKNKKQSKKSFNISLKKEGAATIALVGTTNTGKSTLLKKLTGANVKIDSYEYTTEKIELGVLDYYGIKLQIVEIPSLFENFINSEMGPTYISIIKQANLIILFFNTPREKQLLDKELTEINIPILIFNDQQNIKDEIWKRLSIIKVQTKMPGKKPTYPPIALKRGSTIKDLAEHIHKDFLKNFKERGKNSKKIVNPWARVWGKSVRFQGQRCGYNHKLEDNDVVELHIK